MQWHRSPLADKLLENWWSHVNDETRGEISITSMLRCLTKTYYENRFLNDTEDDLKITFGIGLALEAGILQGIQKPPVGVTDEIEWHGDHFDDEWGFIEVKTTRYGVNLPKAEQAKTGRTQRTPEDFPESWLRQVKGYLYCNKLLKCNVVVLHIIQSELISWQLEFTQEELDENWAYIVERKDIYKQFQELKKPPTAFQYRAYDEECGRATPRQCPFLMLCDAGF